MSHPTDTKHFDPIVGGVAGYEGFNLRWEQISAYITQLQADIAAASNASISATANVNLSARDAVYINPETDEAYPIDAGSVVKSHWLRGFVLDDVNASATAEILTAGLLGGFSGLTVGEIVYADTSGNGTYTQVIPQPALDGGQVALVPMGVAVSSTEVHILPPYMDTKIRYQKRYSPAQNETLTIEHHNNLEAFGREYAAYVTNETTLTEYGSANQDYDSELRGPSGLGDVESYVPTSTVAYSVLGNNSIDEHRTAAQSFEMDDRGVLSQLTFLLDANTGSPTGPIYWEVRAGTNPGSATLLVSGQIANGSIVENGLNTVNVSDGPVLEANTKYWLVLSTDEQTASNFWKWRKDNVIDGTYANGNLRYSLDGGVNYETANEGDGYFSITTDALPANDALAQGFQLVSADNIYSIRLWLKKVGTPTGDLTVTIETDNSGDPSGTAIANGVSSVVAASSLSTSYGWIEFNFSGAPSLLGSAQYHIVLETTDVADNSNYVVWGADNTSPSYSNGELKKYASSTWAAEDADAIFEVIAQGLDYLEPVYVDEYSSSFASMGAQAGDTGGINMETKTTFKCLAAAGYADITCEVVA